ncbi:hypothetical protein [Blastopirellula marina]|uniref:Uncharacterized protein n=1 Tax=Blastopirellula marina TaxID=124 RepID=A0A2S8F6Q9_9BACT|nr:hypothetical protein [Blastopirellula marina]PQO27835.1 hypothetical protein C5Y98_26255 [Blastopirellula marina]PTL41570.1 hypothetical protein C5Y97_26270 [Blastopirellula marina]
MATLYLVCGGPSKDIIDDVFGRNYQSVDTAPGLFDRCRSDDGDIGFIEINGYWIFCGDSGAVFRYHEPLATMLSKSGEALALFGQTTAGFYEIIRYKEGVEVERTLDPYTDAYDRTRFKRKNLEMDDLWHAADRLLPERTEDLFDRPVRWIKLGSSR